MAMGARILQARPPRGTREAEIPVRRTLFRGSRRFEIVLGLGPRSHAALVDDGGSTPKPPDRTRALASLRTLAADPTNLVRLRHLLADATAESALHRLDDAAVLARFAAELLAGRATMFEHPADSGPRA